MPAKLDGERWLRRAAARLAGSLWVRAGITLLLLGAVASRLDWSAIEARLSEGRPLDFLLAVALVVLALAAGAYRWWTLLRSAGVPVEASRLARIYAVSTFSATFLPTTAGGDVARALLVARRGPLLARAAVSVVVDRLGGLVGMIGLAWIAVAIERGAVPAGAQIGLAWATGLFAVAVLAVATAAFGGSRLARRVVPGGLLAAARDSRAVLRGYAGDRPLLGAWILSSLVYQVLIVLQLVVLAHAIDVELPFATAAVALALVTLLTLVPISIGGFGVREASYVVLLGGASIAAGDAVLISVLSAAALLVASLPGAYLIVRGDVGATAEAVPG
jgi:glycosyltransferase 2 family protein